MVLFLVTFLFDTRIGLVFLVLSIVTFYRGSTTSRLERARANQPQAPQAAWKEPWGTGSS
jgi:hypothetical protein